MTKPGQTFLKFRATAPLTPAQFSGSVSNRINAAINAAANDGTDVVLSGEYLVDGPILLQPGVKLIGMNGATLKRPDLSAGYDLMNLGSEGDGFNLRGITFNGNRAGQAVEDYLGALVILDSASTGNDPNSKNLSVEDCKFLNFSRGAMGFHAKGFIGVGMHRNYFTDGGGDTLYHPIYLRRVRDTIVASNRFKDVRFHAIKIQPLTALDRVVVAGNIIDGAGRGIYIPDCANVAVTGNTITNINGTGSGDGGIVLTTDENVAGPNTIDITGNTVSRVVRIGIYCNNSTGVDISGNNVADCGASLINARASREALIAANVLRLTNLIDLVPDGIGGFVDPATLTVAMIDVPTGPSDPRINVGGNVYRNSTTATAVGIRTTATAGVINYGPMEVAQMSQMSTNLSESTTGILRCLIEPTTVTPKGQLSSTGNGMVLSQQGSAASWNLRGDVFQSLNMVRNRGSGTGASALWYGWSSGDSATSWLAINPDTSPRIRSGNGLIIKDATGVDLLNIKSTGAVVGMAVAVASLPSAASNTYGRMFVSNSAVTAIGGFGSIVAGGGANKVPVWSDGTNWLIG